ncbi:hypothetical protein [Vibrio europaeus]|uniref:hypothetical protein n=1 Tax=Vibrio europaeus TaxID=300876 RepID=UPI00148E84F3|nr:hypothetical protein [Vibrio europaeus]MDC5839392.1 hypothetical protein [Vibrio europaeus]NOH23664.1 TetR/AcrR family transcriptional regulator [Vibrio europaeus]
MARITVQEREKKKAELDTIVLSIFWNEGIEALTYARVAELYNTSRGAIQRYYPSQNDFYTSMKGKVMPLMMEKLDWSSSDAFYQSWINALSDKDDIRFQRVIELLFHHALKSPSSQSAIMAIDKLTEQIKTRFGDDSLIQRLLGESFLHLLKS